MTPAEQIIGFLSCVLSGRTPDKAACTLTEGEGERLFRLSSAHDMAHLVGEVLLQNGLLPDGSCRTACMVKAPSDRPKKGERQALCFTL